MATSPFELNILEWDDIPQTYKQTKKPIANEVSIRIYYFLNSLEHVTFQNYNDILKLSIYNFTLISMLLVT